MSTIVSPFSRYFVFVVIILAARVLHAQSFKDITPIGIPQLRNASAALVDIDNDGDLDPLLMGFYGDILGVDDISTLYGAIIFNDNGTISDEQFPITSYYTSQIVPADYNGDGKVDLLLTGRKNDQEFHTTLLKNKGNLKFEIINTPFVNVDRGATQFFDYDNDGDLDVLLVGNRYYENDLGAVGVIRLYENIDNDEFRYVPSVFEQLFSPDAVVGDIDNDGDEDIIQTGGDLEQSTVKAIVYRNNGDKTFTAENNHNMVGQYGANSLLVDFNYDGFLDFIRVGYLTDQTTSFVLSSNTNGVFSDAINAPQYGVSYPAIELTDTDFDNVYEIYYSGLHSDGTTKSYLVDNKNMVLTITELDSSRSVFNGDIVFGDFTGDLRPDLVVAGTNIINNDSDGRSLFLENELLLPVEYNTAPIPSANVVSDNSVRLVWNPINIQGTSYHVEVYDENLNLLTYRIADVNSDHKALGLFRGNAGNRNFYDIKNLDAGTYYWRVQAVNSTLVPGDRSNLYSFDITSELSEEFFDVQQLTYFEDNDLINPVFQLRDYDFDGQLDFHYSAYNPSLDKHESGFLRNKYRAQSFETVTSIDIGFPTYIENSFVTENGTIKHYRKTNDFFFEYDEEGQMLYYPSSNNLKENSVVKGEAVVGNSDVVEKAQKVFFGNDVQATKLELYEYTNFDVFNNLDYPSTIFYTNANGKRQEVRDYTITDINPLYDINGDNVDDLLSATGIHVNLDGEFVKIASVVYSEKLANWYDINSDGLIDISTNDPEIIYFNDGNGSFLRAKLNSDISEYALSGITLSHYIDVNNDGRNDRILSSELQNPENDTLGLFAVYLNTGGIQFDSLVYLHENISVIDFDYGDLNNDGTLDLMYSYNTGDTTLSIGKQSGTIQLLSKIGNTQPSKPTQLTINRNGLETSIVLQKGSDDATPTNMLKYHLFVENDDETIQLSNKSISDNIQSNYTRNGVYLSDSISLFNLPESDNYKFAVYQSDGHNLLSSEYVIDSFALQYMQREMIFDSPDKFDVKLVGDLNSDGITEYFTFVYGDSLVSFYLFDEDRNIIASSIVGNSYESESFSYGYFNDDESLDFIFNVEIDDQYYTSIIYSYKGGYRLHTKLYSSIKRSYFYGNLEGSIDKNLYLIDFIFDGFGEVITQKIRIEDLIVSYADYDYSLYSNTSILSPSQIDLNNDGELDLIGANYNGLAVNSSYGDYQLPVKFKDWSWFDLDGDNKQELFLVTLDGRNEIIGFDEESDAYFDNSATQFTNAGNFSDFLSIDFFNKGISCFTNFEELGGMNNYEIIDNNIRDNNLLRFPNERITQALYTDIDQDNVIDMVYVTDSSGTEKLMAGYSDQISNERPNAPTTLSTVVENNRVELKWNKANDETTPADLLSYDIRIFDMDGNIIRKTYADNTGKRLLNISGEFRTTKALFTNLEDGVYYWQVQSLDGQNIGSPWSVMDTFEVQLNPTITGVVDTCQFLEYTYKASPKGYDYTWITDTNTKTINIDSINEHIKVSFLTTGTHQLIVKNNTYNLFDTLEIEVRPNEFPVIVFSLVNDTSKTNFQFNTQNTQTINTTSWRVVHRDSVISADSLEYDFENFDDYQIGVTNHYANECANTSPLSISVKGPQILGEANPCFFENYLYEVQPVGYKYNWTVVGGAIKNQVGNKITVEWLEEDQHYILIKNLDLDTEDSLAIDLRSSSEALINYEHNAENKLEVTFNIEADLPLKNVDWLIDSDTLVGDSVIKTFESLKIYRVRGAVEYDNGCTVNFDENIELTSPIIEGVDNPCQGMSTKYTATPANQEYLWTIVSGGTEVINQNSPSNEIEITWTDSIGLLRVENVDTREIDEFDVVIRSNEAPTISYALVSDSSSTTVGFTAITDTEIEFYSWDFNTKEAGKDTSNLATPTYDYIKIDEYDASLNVVYTNGCKNGVTQKISVLQPTIIGYDTVCLDAVNTYRVYPSGYKYLWESPGGNSVIVNEQQGLITVEYPDTGIYQLTVFNTDPNVNYSDSIYIRVVDTSRANFDVPESIGIDANVTFLNTSENAVDYQWQIKEATFNDYDLNYTFTEIGNYDVRLIARSTDGCVSEYRQQVFVSQELELTIYNAITTNGDGVNDNLYIENLERYPDNKVVLYSLEGNVIFESDAYLNDWDCTIDGEYIPAGNYICTVQVEGFNEIINQTITVLRK